MLKYIYRDLMSMVRHLPYCLVLGIPVAVLLVGAVNLVRRHGKKEPAEKMPVAAFGIYLSVMLVITFLSRESGHRKGLDLELFSTWGINDRNNAFVVENVLLFIPYGFFGGWAFERMRRFFGCFVISAFTSLCIESLQFVTGRGFFQIDDILTNTLGGIIGFLVFWLVSRPSRS